LKVIQAHAESRPILKMVDDAVTQVVSRDIHGTDSGLAEPIQRVLQQGPSVDRQHRLGDELGQRHQALAIAAGHDNARDGQLSLPEDVIQDCKFANPAVLVQQRQMADAASLHDGK